MSAAIMFANGISGSVIIANADDKKDLITTPEKIVL
jgi:hypothetical protein